MITKVQVIPWLVWVVKVLGNDLVKQHGCKTIEDKLERRAYKGWGTTQFHIMM